MITQPQEIKDIKQEAKVKGSLPWECSDEEKAVFKKPDRKAEDLMVRQYRETGDMRILEQLYELREPTLKVWARRNAYIGDSEEDVLSDLTMVWQRCVERYRYDPEMKKVRTKRGGFVYNEDGTIKEEFKRTTFNTFLFTSLRNYVSNVNKKMRSKKRLDDSGNPIDKNMFSLDYEYGEESDGGRALHEKIEAKNIGHSSGIECEWLIDIVSQGDDEIKRALRLYVSDPRIKKWSTACKLFSGSMPISKGERDILVGGSQRAVDLLREKIKSTGKHSGNFRVLSYQVYNSKVTYEIYCKDTRVLRKVKKALSRCKSRISIDI